MSLIYFVLLTFLISLFIGWAAIPRIVIIAKAKRLFDSPSSRKVHTASIPRLGGVSFFPAAMLAFSFVLGLRYYFGYELTLEREGKLLVEFLFMISGMFLLFFVGLADDVVGVNFKTKFLAQIFAAVMLAFAGLGLSNWEGLFGIYDVPLLVSVPFSVLFIVFVINAFNLIDGVDGLCSGMSTIALTVLGSWYIYMGEYVYAMFAFGMVGVVITFFLYNVLGRRLKIFMGDTGSLTLGYMIVFLGLKFVTVDTASYPDVVTLQSPLILLVGLLFVPLFDTLRVFISRISRGQSPFHPDKTHVHHKLLALGYTHLQSTVILMVATICFLLLNCLLSEVLWLNINTVALVDIVLGVTINFMMNRRTEKLAKNKK